MSNDDFPPPTPSDGSETGLGDLASGSGDGGALGVTPPHGTPQPPPIDSTQMMPVTPSLPPNSPGVPPPPPIGGTPPGAPGVPPGGVVPTETVPEPPWFKRPGAIAGVVTTVLLIGGVIALLFLLGGDDEGGTELTPEPVSFVIVRNNSAGVPVATTLTATVRTQGTAAVDAYTWIVPGDAVPGQDAVRATDATGRTEFRWAPLDDADAATWASTVELAELVAPEGDTPVSGVSAECVLVSANSTDPLVATVDVRPDDADDSLTVLGSYTFPNVRFAAGDRVECTLGNRLAEPPPTTVAESTTTVPDTTTTVAETTTTAPETTTTMPETTTTSTTTTTTTTTTTSTTTTTTTTLAPSDPSLGDVLDDLGLTEAEELLERVGLLAEIEALDQPYTLFAPDNAAIEDLRNDPDGPDLDDDTIVEQLLRAHLSTDGAVDLAGLAELTEITVEFGGPQPVDAGASPPTVGSAVISDADNVVDGGIVHVIDTTLDPQP